MEQKRKHIRFQPDENTFIFVNLDDDIVHGGLCISESHGGCSGVFHLSENFVIGKMCYLKVGKLDSICADIRWITPLDDTVVKVGFEYLN